MNTLLAEALAQAVLSLSKEERQHFDRILTKMHTQEPIAPEKLQLPELNLDNQPFVGMWNDREDMQDSSQWVRNLRQQQWGT